LPVRTAHVDLKWDKVSIYLGLGDLDRGLELLGRAVEERDISIMLSLKAYPYWDPLRSHPAFQALLRKMNLK